VSISAINRAAWVAVNDELGSVLRSKVGTVTIYVEPGKQIYVFTDPASDIEGNLSDAGTLTRASALQLAARLNDAAHLVNEGAL
jgi:hypothetical protein